MGWVFHGVSTDWGAGTHGECSTAISEVLETNRLVSSFNRTAVLIVLEEL